MTSPASENNNHSILRGVPFGHAQHLTLSIITNLLKQKHPPEPCIRTVIATLCTFSRSSCTTVAAVAPTRAIYEFMVCSLNTKSFSKTGIILSVQNAARS